MTHLTAAELQDWRDGRLDHDRARVIGHLAACPDCAARLAIAIRSADDSLEPATGDLEPFLEAGQRAGAGLSRSRGINTRWLALAAVVAIAVAGTQYVVRQVEPTDVMRGGSAPAVRLEAPVGDVAAGAPLRFTWSGTTGPVRLLVVDLDGPPDAFIDTTVTTGSRDVSDADRARFVRGHAYRWFIEYQDASGVSHSTPAASFVLRAP